MITVILIEKFRVKYYYQIWNHRDSLVFAVDLAQVPSERIKCIADATGRDPEWLSRELRSFSPADEKLVRMTYFSRGTSNEITTKVVNASGHRFWNTDGWEFAARYRFKNSVKWQPEYAGILSILRDEPSVRKSKHLYTSA